MAHLSAYNKKEVIQFHKFLSTYLQAINEGREPTTELFRSKGLTKSKLDELFEGEDKRSIKGLNNIVKKLTSEFLKGKTIKPEKYTLGGKPFMVYDFEKGGRIKIPCIYIGVKPDESRWGKYAEWFLWGRGMEHGRGTIVVKHPDAPARPDGVPKEILHIMSEEHKKKYKRKYYAQWQAYTAKWGGLNKEEAKKVVKRIESLFDVINAYPSHLVFNGMLLTATSHVHTFIPHTDVEEGTAEIKQNSYRFETPAEAREFLQHIISNQKIQLKPNENFIHFLTDQVLPYDDLLLFQESSEEQCLVARDKDVIIEVIAPIIRKEYESQMYYIPRVALIKKKDHRVTWPSEEDAIQNFSRRFVIGKADIDEIKWFPKGTYGYSFAFDRSMYITLRLGNVTVETRYDLTGQMRNINKAKKSMKKEIIEKFNLYFKNKRPKKETMKHYLDVIRPLPANLSFGWFVHPDTRFDVFSSRYDMVVDPNAKGIRSSNYFSHPKKLAQYGSKYEYAGSISIDIILADTKYEFHVVTPESLVENEIGRFAKADYQRIKKDAREGEMEAYSVRLGNFLKEIG